MNTITSIFGVLLLTGGLCFSGWYFGRRERVLATGKSKTVAPIFGILSIYAPFVGGFLSYISIYALGVGGGLLIIAFAPLSGVVLAILARRRRERYWALWVFGLLLNAVLFIVFIVALFTSSLRLG
jgi:hypothetical protein